MRYQLRSEGKMNKWRRIKDDVIYWGLNIILLILSCVIFVSITGGK